MREPLTNTRTSRVTIVTTTAVSLLCLLGRERAAQTMDLELEVTLTSIVATLWLLLLRVTRKIGKNRPPVGNLGFVLHDGLYAFSVAILVAYFIILLMFYEITERKCELYSFSIIFPVAPSGSVPIALTAGSTLLAVQQSLVTLSLAQ